MTIPVSKLPVILLIVAVAAISTSEVWLETRGPAHETAASLLYLPNGRFLKAAALGYPTFLADLIYLWSIQYYSSYREEDRFRFLSHVYGNVIARLDPRYVDPYLIGALIMVVEKEDLEGGLRLLEQGMEANPEVWILPYEAGFYAYDVGGDYGRAARYFEVALGIPGVPSSARRIRAEMFNRKGDKETSLQLWTEVLETAEDERVLAVAANHVHDLSIDVDLGRLRTALEGYRQRHGRLPSRLEDLVQDGWLRRVMADPDGRVYEYDAATGEVKSATPFRLRRR